LKRCSVQRAEHALKTQHVYIERFGRMRGAIWNEVQRRHVKNGVRAEFLDASEIVGASDVPFDDAKRPVGAGARGFQMCTPPESEVVDHKDLSARVKQAPDEMRADKSSPTGDQNTLHSDGIP